MLRTLKGKISLVYLFLVVMIGVVGFVSVGNLYSLSKAINGLMTDNYKSINAISNMIEAVERQDSAILIYINTDRQKGIDMFISNQSTFNEWYNIEANNITEPGEKNLVREINDNYTHFIRLFSELQEIRNNQGLEESAAFYNAEITPYFIKLKQNMQSLSLLNEKAMFSGKDKATKNAQKYMYIILMLSAVAAAGGLLVSRFFTNKFLNPLHALTDSIRLIRAGDSNRQINIACLDHGYQNDEIGELAHEFINMTKRLNEYDQSNLGKLLTEKNKSVAIVRSIAEPLIVLDNNYKILLLNQACEAFFNISESEVINKHFLEAIRNGEVFDYISESFDFDNNDRERIISIKKEEESYYFNVIVTTVVDSNAKKMGLIIAFHNVTNLKQLEQIKTEFIANISHEIKTPLTSIIMGASLVQNNSIGELNEKQKDIIEAIQEDGEKLSLLVNDLLRLSKLESGNTVFHLTLCSIEEIIQASIKQHIDFAQQKKVPVFFEVPDELPKIKVDAEKIIWVMNNLISNAIKYTDAGDEIFISSYPKADKLYVSVRDTGIGIPGEYIDKIFDRFFQANDKSSEMCGTGLGLAIAKDIIIAHGGNIWCESKVGEGSNFIFMLPISSEEEKQ